MGKHVSRTSDTFEQILEESRSVILSSILDSEVKSTSKGKHVSIPLHDETNDKAISDDTARSSNIDDINEFKGKHASLSLDEEEAEQKNADKNPEGKHATKDKEFEATEDDSFPFKPKGKHSHTVGTFKKDSEKYSSKAKAAKRQKRSIAISASIALIGSVIGLGMLAATGYFSTPDATVFSDNQSSEVQDNTVTEEFLEQKAAAERQEPLESGAPEGSVEATLDLFGSYDVTKDGIAGISNSSDVFAFNLDEEDIYPAQLSEDNEKKLTEAVKDIRDNGSNVSFILIDLETGRGIACDLDTQTYGASSFKGIFAAYLCEQSEKEEFSIDGVKDTIDNAIVNSDNDSYDWLRQSFESDGLKKWLEDNGVSGDEQLYRDWYPFQSARQSSIIWFHVNDYLNSESDNAKWLANLYENTNLSFIRMGIDDENATVLNKGGWYAATYEDSPDWNGTCDAGIVTCNGHTYLMSVMTGQASCDSANEKTANLARLIWEARADLGAIPE